MNFYQAYTSHLLIYEFLPDLQDDSIKLKTLLLWIIYGSLQWQYLETVTHETAEFLRAVSFQDRGMERRQGTGPLQ